jgi:hypothetical protein
MKIKTFLSATVAIGILLSSLSVCAEENYPEPKFEIERSDLEEFFVEQY